MRKLLILLLFSSTSVFCQHHIIAFEGIVFELNNDSVAADTVFLNNIEIQLIDKQSKKKLQASLTDTTGNIIMAISYSEYINGMLKISKNGYIEKYVIFPTVGVSGFPNRMLYEIELIKNNSELCYTQHFEIDSSKKDSINIDPFISTYSIEFELGKYLIKKESYSCLDAIVEILKNNGNLVVIVARYQDFQPPQYSRTRGMQRANSTIDYFVSKGIAKDRLVAKSYENQTSPNRDHPNWNRTEFRIISFDYNP